MLEVGATILVLAIVATLVTDTLSNAGKMVGAMQRREKIRVADKH